MCQVGDVFEGTLSGAPHFNKERFGVASPFPQFIPLWVQIYTLYAGEGYDKHPKSVYAVYGQYTTYIKIK